MNRVPLALLTVLISIWSVQVVLHQNAHAQNTEQRFERIESWQDKVTTKLGDLGERITRAETTLDTNNKLMMGVLASVLALMVERVFARTETKRSSRREVKSE